MADINIKKASVEELVDLLQRASEAYYNSAEPLISDDLFDLAKDRLEKLAPNHPYLKQVGAPVSGSKVKLPFYMGSLDKIRDDPKALDKWKAKYDGDMVVSDKLDGNSGLLVYTSRGSIALYSRGDGEMGQDLSNILQSIDQKTVPSITKINTQLKGHSGSDILLAVRGELIISKNNWKKISDRGANARNVVAGAMHTKVPDPSIANHIEFVSYELIYPYKKPSEGLNFLEKLGFKVVDNTLITHDDMNMDVLSEFLMQRRKDSNYEIDGVVVTHDEHHKIIKGKNPKYAFAFKTLLTHEEAEVIVSEVVWNVSKDGYYKPTVLFAPVVISGVKIQRATGFNAAFIEKNVIGVGARVIIVRSGDVIPHIIRVVSPAASGKPDMPDAKYVWTDTHVDIMVPSGASISKEQQLKSLTHFAKTLDIKHVAERTLKKLVDAGFDTIPKLLAIKKEDLMKIEGFQAVSAEKVATSLNQISQKTSCVDLMAASNIFGRGFGKARLQTIVDLYPSILDKKMPTIDEVKKVNGIGHITAKAFIEGLPKFFELLTEIKFNCKQKPVSTSANLNQSNIHNKLKKNVDKMNFVFTGFRNKEWEELIVANGGKMQNTVTKTTNVVVAIDLNEDSSKLKKARELNVNIISKAQFEKTYI